MEFGTDGRLTDLTERGREVGRTLVAPNVATRDRAAAWDPDLFGALAGAGLTGPALPVDAGGLGLSRMEAVALLEGFGAGAADPGLALSLGVHGTLIGLAVHTLGSPQQRGRLLPAIATGQRVAALSLSELDAGAVSAGDGVTATRTPDGWLLAGERVRVVNAPYAAHFLLTAATGAGRTAFLLDRDTAGLTVRPRPEPTALRTAPMADVVLADCVVPDAAVLGTVDHAAIELVPLLVALDRTCLSAPWLGYLRALAARLGEVATGRVLAGGRLVRSQTVRLAVVDVHASAELAAGLLYRAAWQLDRPEPASRRDAASARLFLMRALADAVRTATGLTGLEPDDLTTRLGRDLGAHTAIGGGEQVLHPVIAGAVLAGDR